MSPWPVYCAIMYDYYHSSLSLYISHLTALERDRFDPVFTQIYPETLTVRKVSFWEALRLSGSYPELSPPEGVETLPLLDFVKAMHKKGSGPVVVFPEVCLQAHSCYEEGDNGTTWPTIAMIECSVVVSSLLETNGLNLIGNNNKQPGHLEVRTHFQGLLRA